MSGMLVRLACTTALAAQAVLVPAPAAAAPDPQRPGAGPQRSVSQLLTDLQQLYRQAEQATETYNATAEKLKRQRAEVARLDGELARTRLALQDSRADAGRLARRQYQSTGGLGPYVRLLLAPDPQDALDESHVIGELARVQARTVHRLTAAEKQRDTLARAARKALDAQLTLADQQKKQRDEVRGKLGDVERLLATLTPGQLAAVAALEQRGVTEAQHKLVTAGSLPANRAASAEGARAVRYALYQLGKPYMWGAEGPDGYDCSGLTSGAWQYAGRSIPRTSQEQWRRLKHIPLGDLRPGDLVVYFPDATHVAMYVGDGKVVQAPRPGANVQLSPLASNPVLGAVRPDDQAPATDAR
ncbi:NlpC/P60 family protein [Streptomyces sp. NPDC001093]|uniref:C40 family peptidase n=1 Tax=Streptomyces sp. NPDC001093 TaxID=3154376 RepID=UPI00331E7ED5